MSSDQIVCVFERRSNHFVHSFKMCDSQTLCRIFSSHCESFDGCEILKYTMSYSMFRGAKLFVMFLDCPRKLIIL